MTEHDERARPPGTTGARALDRLVVVRGDLTLVEVDAIVNAANAALAGGGGVDGALHRAAGPGLMEECRALHPRGCPTGEVRVTGAHGLRARWVLHAVGPIWSGGGAGEKELLAACYRRSIATAARLGARTVAFPAIACGAYGYPWPAAAEVAVGVLEGALAVHRSVVEARLVLVSEELATVFERAIELRRRGG